VGIRGTGAVARRRSLATLGGLLAVVAAATMPAVARADSSPIDLSVTDGWTGTLGGGSWLPVVVTLHNRGGDFRGQVVLTVQGGDGSTSRCFVTHGGKGTFCQSFGNGNQSGSDADYAAPVALAAGVTKTVTFTVLAGSPSVHVRVLDDGGHVAVATDHDLDVSFGGQRTVVAVVSTSSGSLDNLATVRTTAGQTVEVVHLRPGDLPAQGVPLASFDAVVLDHAPTDTLSSGQRQAIVDYVEGGGALLIIGGSDAKATLAGLPAGLAPVTYQGTTSIHGMPQLAAMVGNAGLDATVPAVRVQPHGTVAFREGELPLLIVARRGLGQVAFAAVDPGAQPLASWAGDQTLLRRLLLRTISAQGGGPQSTVSFSGSPGTQAHTTLAAEMGPVGQAVALIPGIGLPDASVLGLMLVGYIVVAGPLSYMVLRRLRRRDLLWVTAPAIAVVATVLAYSTGLGTSGRGLTINEVRVLHIEPGSDRATVDAFAMVFSPHGGTHEVRLDGSPYVTSLPGGNTGQLTAMPQNTPVIAQLTSAAASLSGYSATRTAQLNGGITADLHDDGVTTTGTVTNRLDADLVDAYVVDPDGQVTSIGTVARGQTIQVHADHRASGFNRGMNYGGGYAMPLLGSGITARRQYLQQQVVSALQTSGAEAGRGRPVLVALAANPLLPNDVSGDGVDATVLDAVVVPLAADVSGTVNSMAAALVDGSDSTAGDGSGASGWGVYEASLPTGGGWKDLTVAVDASCGPETSCILGNGPPISVAPVPLQVLPPGAGGSVGFGIASGSGQASSGPGGSGSSAAVQVYNVHTQTWVELGTGLTGTQQYHVGNPRDYVDADGNVWIRVEGAGAPSPDAVRISADPSGAPS